jgi:hypothetical protein
VQKVGLLNPKAALTKPIITGTSTSGQIMVANTSPELIPNTAKLILSIS